MNRETTASFSLRDLRRIRDLVNLETPHQWPASPYETDDLPIIGCAALVEMREYEAPPFYWKRASRFRWWMERWMRRVGIPIPWSALPTGYEVPLPHAYYVRGVGLMAHPYTISSIRAFEHGRVDATTP